MKEATRHLSEIHPEFINSETNDRKLRRVISEGKTTTDSVINLYTWTKVGGCGFWVYPDGRREPISEEYTKIKKLNYKYWRWLFHYLKKKKLKINY